MLHNTKSPEVKDLIGGNLNTSKPESTFPISTGFSKHIGKRLNLVFGGYI